MRPIQRTKYPEKWGKRLLEHVSSMITTKNQGSFIHLNKIQEKIGQTYDLKRAKMQCNTQYNAIHAM